ncbi:MAG: HIT family protein [Phycisphaerales bacterium]|jgi:diadenosine tetraphosphate (Ap4A) HIT family hydrolase|nr:HIT family protein [Phycisphaerales bacterium]
MSIDTENSECLFCGAGFEAQIVETHRTVAAVPDAAPVSPGHMLIVTLRHTEDVFSMTPDELADAMEMIGILKRRALNLDPSITGFNIGANCGVSAGQQVMHAHIHFIPRRGDEPLKGVIRNKMAY